MSGSAAILAQAFGTSVPFAIVAFLLLFGMAASGRPLRVTEGYSLGAVAGSETWPNGHPKTLWLSTDDGRLTRQLVSVCDKGVPLASVLRNLGIAGIPESNPGVGYMARKSKGKGKDVGSAAWRSGTPADRSRSAGPSSGYASGGWSGTGDWSSGYASGGWSGPRDWSGADTWSSGGWRNDEWRSYTEEAPTAPPAKSPPASPKPKPASPTPPTKSPPAVAAAAALLPTVLPATPPPLLKVRFEEAAATAMSELDVLFDAAKAELLRDIDTVTIADDPYMEVNFPEPVTAPPEEDEVLDVPMVDVLELMVAPPEDEWHVAPPAPPAPTIPPLFFAHQKPPRPVEPPPQAKPRPPTAPPPAAAPQPSTEVPVKAPPPVKPIPPTAPPQAKLPAPAPPPAKPPAPAPPLDTQPAPQVQPPRPAEAPPSRVKAPPPAALRARMAAPTTPSKSPPPVSPPSTPKLAAATHPSMDWLEGDRVSKWCDEVDPCEASASAAAPLASSSASASAAAPQAPQPAEPPFPPPEALLRGRRWAPQPNATRAPPMDEPEDEPEEERPAPPPYPSPQELMARVPQAEQQVAPPAVPYVMQLGSSMVVDDPISRWIRTTLTALPDRNGTNLAVLLRASGVDPELDIAEILQAQVNGVDYLRLVWREGRGWQRASLFDTRSQAEMLRGGHGATSIGTVGILRSRAISKMTMAGVYGLFSNYEDFSWLLHTMGRVAKGTKNWGGALIELRARCCWQPAGWGGVEEDARIVATMTASHQSKSNGSRWCVPEEFLDFVGLWIPLNGYLCDDLPGCYKAF